MSLNTQLTSGLTRLIGYSSTTPHCLRLSAPQQVVVEIDLLAVDSMSCSVQELRLIVPTLVDADFELLKKWSEALCKRITYILESIGPLEFSPDSGEVLIRSNPPNKQSGTTQFYEMILRSHQQGNFSLRRYRAEKGVAGRTEIAMQITHEVLKRLINDFVETIPPQTTSPQTTSP